MSTTDASGAPASESGKAVSADTLRVRIAEAAAAGATADFEGAIVEAVDLGTLGEELGGLPALNFRDTVVLGPVRLEGVSFAGEVDFGGSQFRAEARFEGARFRAACFDGARFQHSPDFTAAQFDGMAMFQGCEFLAGARFAECRFGAASSFLEAHFAAREQGVLGKMAPERTTTTLADFASCRFADDAMFGAVRFECDANFARAQFARQAYFKRAEFGASALFDPTSFASPALFTAAIFRGNARFSGPGAEQSDLRDASFEAANLAASDLRNARVRGASFKDADLHDARFDDAREALSEQFAGANVTGAHLPPEISAFKGLAYVQEASKYARNLFVAMLVGCVYAWLTIATTADADLIANLRSTPLPIIQTAVPMAGFYVAAPVLLLVIFVYFHLCLQRLWEVLAQLPARMPDGKPLHQHAHPWLLNGLVQAHFARLRAIRSPSARVENLVSVCLAWWVVPFTVGLFWMRYLARQDWIGTLAHVAVVAATMVAALASYRLAIATLSGAARRPSVVDPGATRGGRGRADGFTPVLVASLLLLVVSAGVLAGRPVPWFARTLTMDLTGAGSQPGASAAWPDPRGFAYLPYAKLDRQALSTLPPSPSPPLNTAAFEEWLYRVERASLRGANLRYADLSEAILVHADLRDANLRGATLSRADLRRARLDGARLPGAVLAEADLRAARLVRADLTGAILIDAAMDIARLDRATLREARLNGARLDSAHLESADLTGADLRGARLVRVRLNGARLAGADLRGVEGLTCAELTRADGYASARRDPRLACGAALP